MTTPIPVRAGAALAAALLMTAPALAAKSVGTPCPGSLQINQAPASLPEGWTAMPDPRRNAAHLLQAITFFAGHPEEMQALSPDTEKRTPKGYSSSWHFAHGQGDYYIGCNYTDTNYLVVRKLAGNISQCDLNQFLADRKRPGGAVEMVCY